MSSKLFEPVKTKFNPRSNLDSKKRTYTAIGLAMLLTFVSVMVYMISSLDEDAILSQDEVDVELNEWHTYYVESENDLPECGDETFGRLYYIESSEKFEACTSNGWITVDIKGEDGSPGQDVDPTQLESIENNILELNNATACQLLPYGNCAGADQVT